MADRMRARIETVAASFALVAASAFIASILGGLALVTAAGAWRAARFIGGW